MILEKLHLPTICILSFLMFQIQYYMNIYKITMILQICFCNHLKVFCNYCDKNANFENIIQICAGNLFCLRKEEGKKLRQKESFICETCSADINNVCRFLESLDSFRLWLIGVKRTLYQPSNGNYERRSRRQVAHTGVDVFIKSHLKFH